jgi:probable rRNA maturation factor
MRVWLNGSSLGRKIDRRALTRTGKTTLGVLGFLDSELGITLVDDARMAELAGTYGRRPEPTDVLAFSMLEGEGSDHRGHLLGDVVVSIDTAERQARARRVSLDAELRDLVIHGILHLIGLDHERAVDARQMRQLEAHLRWELGRDA